MIRINIFRSLRNDNNFSSTARCSLSKFYCHGLGTPRPGTEVSRALRARNPKRVRKESERVSRPREPQSPPKSALRSPKRVQKRGFGLFWTLFGLLAHSLGMWSSPGRDTLSDSFRTLLGFRARRARETSVPGQGVPKSWRFPRKVAFLADFPFMPPSSRRL